MGGGIRFGMAESEPECLRLNSAISLPPRLCAKHACNRRRRKRLRAKVALSGGFAYTRALGGRVKNASGASDATQRSAVSFVSGNASPRVETEIVASDPRPSGATDVKFGWQRCPNTTSPHTDCVYITVNWHRMSYTPVAAMWATTCGCMPITPQAPAYGRATRAPSPGR